MRFDTEQVEAFRRHAALDAVARTASEAAAAAAQAARAPMPGECRRSEEIRQQQDGTARDTVKEVNVDGHRYACLGFLKSNVF